MSIPVDTWGGLLVAMVLLVFGVPTVARIAARYDDDPRIFKMVMWSGAFKLAFAPLWIYVIDHFYGGIADAYTYNHYGLIVAQQIRNGDYNFAVGKVLGNGSTSLVTGFLYVLIDSNTLGGFFAFSFLSFISLVVFYRAFRVGLPDADGRRYAWVVLFYPGLLFWTDAIGKDALISLGLSVATLGGARLVHRRRGWAVPMAAGLAFTALIRPHVALMLFAAFALAFPFSRSRRVSALGPLAKVFQIGLLIVGGLVLAKVTAHFFGLKSLNPASVQHELNNVAKNTGTGASNTSAGFASSTSSSTSLSPLAIPKDFYDTMMRPLPFQAHGLTQLVSSLENLMLVGLLIASWRRIAAGLRSMLREPYVVAMLVYCLVWILLFASIGNLGILARERTSVLPFLFVFLAIKPRSRRNELPVTEVQPAPALAHATSV